jgi:hypothetical protein
MTNPWVVALASVIPGLGFLVQAKIREAVISFAVVTGLVAVFLLTTSELAFQASCGLLPLVWIAQGYLAFSAARREARFQSGASERPREGTPLPSVPQNVPRSKRISFRARRTVEGQVQPGERVEAAVLGTARGGLSAQALFGAMGSLSAKQYSVGLTQTHLVLIQLDIWGKPAEITRKPRQQIKSASFSKGLLTDRLTLKPSQGGAIKLSLPRNQREEAEIIASALATK